MVTFAVTWTAWAVVLALGGDPSSSPLTLALWVVGGFGPPIGALVAARRDGDDRARDLLRRLIRWRVGLGWYALIAFPLAVAVAAVAILGWPAAPDASLLGTVTATVPAFVIMAVAGGGLEELGWRGYAVPHLQARVGALPAAVGIGLVWAVWHLPLYAMVDTTQADGNFAWFTLQAVALSILLTFVYNGTGDSLLLPVLLHAAVNSFYSSVLIHVEIVDYARFEMLAAVLMSATAITVAATRPRLHHPTRDTNPAGVPSP